MQILGLLLLAVAVPLAVASSGYFWQITDVHYDPTYETTQESCNDVINNPGKYGDYECDSPWILIESSVKAMFQNGSSPDFILWTGDTTHHPKKHDALSEAKVIQFLQNVTDLLTHYFPTTPVVVTLGNHDYYPVNQLPGETNPIYQATADMWRDWLNSDDAYETFKQSAYYTTLLLSVGSKLRVLVVNTNLYLTSDKVTVNQTDPGGQLAWTGSVLEDARSTKEKVLVIIHVPVGVLEQDDTPKWMREKPNAELNRIFRKYSDVIIAVISAHQHSDTFRIFYDSDDSAVATMLVAPAVTPWRARFGVNERGPAHNPGVRKVTFDPATFDLDDIEQYYLDLENANDPAKAEWRQLYSFKDIYGVQDVSTGSLQQLVEQFSTDGSEKFLQYYDYNYVDTKQPSNKPCDCRCKNIHLCSIKNVDINGFIECRSDATCDAQRLFVSVVFVVMVALSTLQNWLP